MLEFLRNLFNADFMPHGTCYLWKPEVLWLNVISDVLIAISYYAIPFLLFRFARSRRDLTFQWIFVAFGLFIFACGTTHALGALTAWIPVYRLDGVVKAITAGASLATLILLIPVLPMLVALPSPSQLKRMNESLAAEVEDRKSAEAKVQAMNEQLEERVASRTVELARSESRFRELAEAMPSMVWTADGTGRTVYFNRQWREYTGGGASWDVVHEDDRPSARDAWERARRDGERFEAEYRIRRADGVYRWFLVRATPVKGADGSVEEWYGACTDIDDQKRHSESLQEALSRLREEMRRRQQLEDQLLQSQKMEAVGRLAGGVAHDFNNLLTAILGYAEMLKEGVAGSPELAEFADEVKHAAERASDLTSQLLAFSRRRQSQPQPVEFGAAVAGIEKMLRRIIGEDVALKTVVQPGLPRVMIDPVQLDQVMLNLAVNARDAMPNGGNLIIETSLVEIGEEFAGRYLELKPGRYVMLAVSDTGIGMSAETRARIFEPFFTTKPTGKGTGLGLSIVYGIVKQSGGEILVYSEPGKGTTFKLYFPPAAASDEAPSSEPAAATGRGDGTVLVAEDEDLVRNLTRTMLERQGYRVLPAATPGEALGLLRDPSNRVDLLLTDVVMPEMNGVELAKAARALRPGLKVLYMSGYTEGGVELHGEGSPGARFVQKPFSAAVLYRSVRLALES